MENAGIYAQFSIEAVNQPFKSTEAGRPIFEDREFVRIVVAGDKNSEVYREATEYDKERFHEVYDRFKKGLKGREQITGTPLSQWPILRPSQIKELEAIEIYTVEGLANLSDTMKQNLGMGAHELVAQAKAYLDAANDGAAGAKLAAENSALRDDIADLKRQLSEINDRFAQEERRGPGRPPKAAKENSLEL